MPPTSRQSFEFKGFRETTFEKRHLPPGGWTTGQQVRDNIQKRQHTNHRGKKAVRGVTGEGEAQTASPTCHPERSATRACEGTRSRRTPIANQSSTPVILSEFEPRNEARTSRRTPRFACGEENARSLDSRSFARSLRSRPVALARDDRQDTPESCRSATRPMARSNASECDEGWMYEEVHMQRRGLLKRPCGVTFVLAI